MGACASKPKDLHKHDAAIPEAPVTPKKPDVQITPQEKKDGEETKNEAPLVELSEPAPEAPKAEEVVAETAPPPTAEIVPEPTPKPVVEETPAAANVEEDKAAPKVEEKKEAEAVTEVAEVKTEEPPKAV